MLEKDGKKGPERGRRSFVKLSAYFTDGQQFELCYYAEKKPTNAFSKSLQH